MFNDLTELTAEQQLRAECINQVVMASNPGLPPNVIVDYARILEDHILQNDKRDGDSSDEDVQVNEYAETTQQGPIDQFRTELKHLLNRYSIDNDLNTPDWILADALTRHLDALFVFNQDLARWELDTGRAVIEPETKVIRRDYTRGEFGVR